MYGFPKDLNLDGLIGHYLAQLYLSPGSVELIHDCDIRICAVCCPLFVFENKILICKWDDYCRWTNADFQKLLSLNVTGWKIIADRTLEIQYENGFSLHLVDDSDQYESVHIYFADKLSVIA